jgi:hypothetical protein
LLTNCGQDEVAVGGLASVGVLTLETAVIKSKPVVSKPTM